MFCLLKFLWVPGAVVGIGLLASPAGALSQDYDFGISSDQFRVNPMPGLLPIPLLGDIDVVQPIFGPYQTYHRYAPYRYPRIYFPRSYMQRQHYRYLRRRYGAF